jgi:tight adherence protein B
MLVAILILTFATTFLIASVAVTAGSFLLGLRLAPAEGAGSLAREQPLLLRQELLSTISVWHRLLARFDFAEILKTRTAEAGLRWSVGRVTLMMLLLGTLGAAALFAADWAPVITVPLAAAAGLLAPYLFILRKRKMRLQKIEDQFPDALDSLSRALRAGQSFGAGMDLVAGECPEPLAQEMRQAWDEWRLGLGWNEALENLARRLPLLEVRLFAAAVVLQGRSGGRLNEILEELAKTIRDSIALRGDIRAISAQGRISGAVLTVLPIALTGILWITSPAYIGVLFRHPYGKYLVAGGLICLALGHLSIQRIVDVKV